MLSEAFCKKNGRTTADKKKNQLIKIGFVSFLSISCLVAVAWQSTSQKAAHNPRSVSTMARIVGAEKEANVKTEGDVDGLPPVLTKNGQPVRVAGSCLKTTPKKTNNDVAHVTLHLNGETEHLNVTEAGASITEQETRMLNSIHRSAHPEDYAEAARLELLHTASGRKKTVVIRVRKDAPEMFQFNSTMEDPYANKTVTPSLLRKFVQDSKMSFTQEDARVPIADVLAGCELLMEGKRKFSLKEEKKVKGKVYLRYVEVEMLLMTGCEATENSIYGEFREVEAKKTLSVTCASHRVETCEVETIDGTGTVTAALNEYEKTHGDGPIDSETMQKVAADVLPRSVGRLNVQVAPDCFGKGYNFFLCALAIILVGPIALVMLVVTLTSGPAAAVQAGRWWFSGLIQGGGGGGCFPRGVGILLMTGQAVDVAELSVGSAVWSLRGQSNWIYMQGHRDVGAVREFVWITTSSGRAVGASRGHFGIVFDGSTNGMCHEWKSDGKVAWTWEMFDLCHVHKRFEEFLDGEKKKWSVFVHGSAHGNSSAVWLEDVVGAEERTGFGLYNPYSMDGTLVANGILVSAHSEFILDDAVPARYSDVLPKVYQFMFSPLRGLYRLCPGCAIKTDRFLDRGAGEHSASEVVKAIWRSFVQPQLRSLV